MIYEFFTDKTFEILSNCLSSFCNLNKSMIMSRYESYVDDSKDRVSTKRFKIIYDHLNIFEIYLLENGEIKLLLLIDLGYSSSFAYLRSYIGSSVNNIRLNEFKQYLMNSIRDFKLNQIL